MRSHRRSSIVGLCVLIGCGPSSQVEPDVPVVSLVAPSADSVVAGVVPVSYSVRDRASRLVNVRLAYRTSANAFSPLSKTSTSPGTAGLMTSPDGVSYQMDWDTVRDLGYTRVGGVELRAEVTLGTVDGIPSTAGPIVVDNTALPRTFSVSGRVTRALSFRGTDGREVAVHADRLKSGNMLIALLVGTPPCLLGCTFAYPLVPILNVDFRDAQASVPFAFHGVAQGEYVLAIVFDHDKNATPQSVVPTACDLLYPFASLLVDRDVSNHVVELNLVMSTSNCL